MPIPVILDVDTGVDDALALLLAAQSPALQLLGVTCVTGNVGIDQVTRNTLQVLEVAGRSDVPVAQGRAAPLLEKVVSAAYVHGGDGLGQLSRTLPAPARRPVAQSAVAFLAEILRDAPEPVTLIPLGPLSNIALLLLERPEAAAKVARIVLMGGAVGMGNATAVSEFNIRQDPEAADIVLRSGLDVTLYTWDVFTQVTFDSQAIAAMIRQDAPAARLAGQLLQFMQRTFKREQVSIGDAGAVCSVIRPDGLATERWPVRVELEGRWTRGMTVVDQRPKAWIQHESGWQKPWLHEATVSTGVDVKLFRRLFWQAVIEDPASPEAT